jgi:hypothetical protein
VNLAQLQALAASNGFPDANLAAAIAMAESGGDPNAYNTEGSYGLWQIDIKYHPEYASDPSVLFDPTTNARAAYKISSGGKDWSPWSTYRCPCTGCGTSGPACYLQWYAGPPAVPALSKRKIAGAVVVVAGAGVLAWLAWQEYRRPGLLLPWRAA